MSLTTLLKDIYFFESFTNTELKRIEDISERRKYLPGQAIFEQGAEASKVYVIEVGTVSISKNDDQDGLIKVGKGGMFGEMPFLDGGKRSATAEAIEETHLILIPYTELSTILLNHPDMALKFFMIAARYVSKRLRATTESLQQAKEILHRHF